MQRLIGTICEGVFQVDAELHIRELQEAGCHPWTLHSVVKLLLTSPSHVNTASYGDKSQGNSSSKSFYHLGLSRLQTFGTETLIADAGIVESSIWFTQLPCTA